MLLMLGLSNLGAPEADRCPEVAPVQYLVLDPEADRPANRFLDQDHVAALSLAVDLEEDRVQKLKKLPMWKRLRRNKSRKENPFIPKNTTVKRRTVITIGVRKKRKRTDMEVLLLMKLKLTTK